MEQLQTAVQITATQDGTTAVQIEGTVFTSSVELEVAAKGEIRPTVKHSGPSDKIWAIADEAWGVLCLLLDNIAARQQQP